MKYGFRYVDGRGLGPAAPALRARAPAKARGRRARRRGAPALAPLRRHRLRLDGLAWPLVIAAALPLVQAPENVAGTAHSAARALRPPRRDAGVVDGTATRCDRHRRAVRPDGDLRRDRASRRRSRRPRSVVVGLFAFRRFPPLRRSPSATTAPAFARSSCSRARRPGRSRCARALAPLLLGIVAGPTQVGLFRIAQAPQAGLRRTQRSRAPDPAHRADARLGARARRACAPRRAALHLVSAASTGGRRRVPLLLVMRDPDRARLRLDSTSARRTPRGSCSSRRRCSSSSAGRSRSPSRSGGRGCGRHARRRDARAAAARGDFRRRVGRDGRGGGGARLDGGVRARVGSCYLRVSRGPSPGARPTEALAPVKVLVVSGIWPPDVGGPASHAPELAAFLRARGHEVEVVTTADAGARLGADYPVHWVSRAAAGRAPRPCGGRLVARRARQADVVYTTGMVGRSRAAGPALARRRTS